MKVKLVTRIAITAKPAMIFEYLSDMKYHYLWNPQILSLKPIMKLQQGSTYEATSQVLGVKIMAHNEVTKFIAGKEIEIQNSTGMVQYRTNFRLAAKNSVTTVVCTSVVSSDSRAFAFAKPVLERLARRELQTDLQALKIAAEQQLE